MEYREDAAELERRKRHRSTVAGDKFARNQVGIEIKVAHAGCALSKERLTPSLVVHTCSTLLNMRAVATNTDSDQLFEIAEGQQGYFTSGQAVDAGFARSAQSYHVAAGNWVREHRGIYRLRRYPQSDDGQLVLWSLWSRNLDGEPEGVYSHLTALRIKDLSDANPVRLDMTVPLDFRRNSAVPPILRLHKAHLAPEEIIREHGYSLTSPMRTILDLAMAGDTDRAVISQAFQEGRARGLIARKQIAAACLRTDLPPWLRKLIEPTT